MDLEKLYESAHDIPEYRSLENKYNFLGFNKVVKARVLTIGDSFGTSKLNGFIKKYGTVYLFPNYVNGSIVDISVRPLNSSKEMLTLRNYLLPYNVGNISKDFKYGDTLFLVEGIGDLGALKLIDPALNIVALKTNNVTKDMYSMLSSLTNKVVMIPDADNKGMLNVGKIGKAFSNLGVDFQTIKQYGDMKDTGEFVDMIIEHTKTHDGSLLGHIESVRDYYLAHFSLLK